MTEGTAAARAQFTRGLLALHSFWYDEAERAFQAAIDADPSMNMAYWGAALSRCKLLWGDDDLSAARQLISRMPDPDRLSPREQAWVVALIELVREGDVRTSRKRFVAAMETVHAQFPDDESATFLAAALLAAMRPDDPDSLEVRKRAGALASGVFAHNPRHPGAAHYFIHAYDTPELAAQALPFARAYARIAPAAFHARHMPAHIFSRLGMWKEAIASCQAAWDASVAAAGAGPGAANRYDFHSLTWMIEMYFELGQRSAAERALGTFATAVRGGLLRQHRALYANQVTSFMVRTGGWARIDELLAPLAAASTPDPAGPPLPGVGAGSGSGSGEAAGAGRSDPAGAHCASPPVSSPLALLEQSSAIDARARAAAMLRDLAKLARLIQELEATRAKLRPFFQMTQPKDMLARLDKAHARHLQLLRAYARADDRAAIDVLRQLAEDEIEPSGEANPNGFVAREALGEALLRLDRAKDAAVELAATLRAHPGRARALLAAARAATQAHDRAAAQSAYAQLARQWEAADADTEGLAEARTAASQPR